MDEPMDNIFEFYGKILAMNYITVFVDMKFGDFQLCDASNQKTHESKVVVNKNRH